MPFVTYRGRPNLSMADVTNTQNDRKIKEERAK
jgi:hypothetical protein